MLYYGAKLFATGLSDYQVQNQDNIVLFAMGKTADREALFKWACPIEEVHLALYALKKNKIKISAESDLSIYCWNN